MTAYLDISPLITAVRRRPQEFEWVAGMLHHVPTNHTFRFDPEGNAAVLADCACATLTISRQQGRELYETVAVWTRDYWRPRVINRHFASHFEQPSLFKRLCAWLGLPIAEHDDDLDLGLPLPEDAVGPSAEVVPLPTRTEAPEDERLAA